MKPNFKNRTLFHGDNLDFLRAMNSNTIDLIATDPPFNKGRDFHASPDSLSSGASFQDRWSWKDDVHEEWLDEIADDWPDLMKTIENSRHTYGDDMGAYLCFMAVRLISMRRVLKNTGSIYLHCDPTASHYLKMVLDCIFGRKNFRNEIVWYYKNASRGKHSFAKSHDLIFWYSKSAKFIFNRDKILVPFESGMTEWRYEKGGQKDKEMPKGKTPDDVIIMSSLNAMANERTGYPTQKPLSLYRRILQASSREGDFVLDPFAGCATTLVVAESLDRKWVGIDIWDKAHEVVLDRFRGQGLKDPEGKSEESLQARLKAKDSDVLLISDPPERTDSKKTDAPPMVTIESIDEPPDQYKTRAEKVKFLVRQNGMKCQGCNREFDDVRYLELDHNTPRSNGGLNHITNRILLCSPCNKLKSDKYTLFGLQAQNKKLGYMKK